jgi:hypothetical protein
MKIEKISLRFSEVSDAKRKTASLIFQSFDQANCSGSARRDSFETFQLSVFEIEFEEKSRKNREDGTIDPHSTSIRFSIDSMHSPTWMKVMNRLVSIDTALSAVHCIR